MSDPQIIKFAADAYMHDAPAATPTAAPIGEPVSLIQSHAVAVDKGRAGVWTSSPGRWHRQIMAAEYCMFLAGECTFQPEHGQPIEIRAGDVLYFPANSTGIWDIKTECRKAFFVFV